MWTIFTKGGPVMYPLLLCSIVAVTVVLDRAIFWWREGRRRDEEQCDQVVALAGQGRFDQARALCQETSGPVGRVLAAGLEHYDAGPARAMEQAAAAEVRRMRRLMVVLDSMITIAPLLGILGTVTGIIHSFDMLGVDPAVGAPREVVSGIAQALITTAAGLTIAVCCLLPFNYFQHKTEHQAENLENWGTRLELSLLRNGGKS